MPRDIALEVGKHLRVGVRALRGKEGNADLILLLDEDPDFITGMMAKQCVEQAAVVRADRDCFRLTDPDLAISMPALPRPTLAELQAEWGYIKEIERDDSTEEATVLRLGTILKSTETEVSGEVYERRLVRLRTDGKLLGFQHRKWLVAHQDDAQAIPDPKVRAALKALLGKVYIDFSGLIVVDEGGSRNVPYASQDGRRWSDDWDWLGSNFDRGGRIALASK